MNPRKFPRLE